jgi:hypothetical protein
MKAGDLTSLMKGIAPVIGTFVRETVEKRAAGVETTIRRLEASNEDLRRRLERLEKKAGAGRVKLI